MITRSHTKGVNEKPVNEVLLQVPLKNTGLIEDKIFKNDFMMEEENQVYLEGLPYSQIQKDQKKVQYLERLKQNMPGYWMKTKKQKNEFFRKVNKQYECQNQIKEERNTTPKKKCVSFSDHESFKVFDKKQTPHKVSFSAEKNDLLKQ